MSNLDVKVRLTVRTTLSGTQGASTPIDDFSETITSAFTNGTNAAQATVEYHDTHTLTNGASVELDLAGVLTNGIGQTVTFAKVRGMLVHNQGTNVATDVLVVGGTNAATWDGWTTAAASTFKVGPGGYDLKVNPSLAGFAVAATTGDKIKFTNSGSNTMSFDLRLWGS